MPGSAYSHYAHKAPNAERGMGFGHLTRNPAFVLCACVRAIMGMWWISFWTLWPGHFHVIRISHQDYMLFDAGSSFHIFVFFFFPFFILYFHLYSISERRTPNENQRSIVIQWVTHTSHQYFFTFYVHSDGNKGHIYFVASGVKSQERDEFHEKCMNGLTAVECICFGMVSDGKQALRLLHKPINLYGGRWGIKMELLLFLFYSKSKAIHNSIVFFFSYWQNYPNFGKQDLHKAWSSYELAFSYYKRDVIFGGTADCLCSASVSWRWLHCKQNNIGHDQTIRNKMMTVFTRRIGPGPIKYAVVAIQNIRPNLQFTHRWISEPADSFVVA